MKKLDAGEWQLVDGTVALAKASEASGTDTKAEDASESGPSTGGSADAILKRLMQQREKELNK